VKTIWSPLDDQRGSCPTTDHGEVVPAAMSSTLIGAPLLGAVMSAIFVP